MEGHIVTLASKGGELDVGAFYVRGDDGKLAYVGTFSLEDEKAQGWTDEEVYKRTWDDDGLSKA